MFALSIQVSIMKSLFLIVPVLLFSQPVMSVEYQSTYSVDVTGDGKNEIITYRLKNNANAYEGLLKIVTTDNKVLWDHEYQMSQQDLVGDLLMNEGNISIEHWVKHFFDGTLSYGAGFEKAKINADEISMDFLEFYSKQLKHSPEALKQLILRQKINRIFTYRASWREELVMLVYIPELNRMVHYSGGEY